MALTAHKLIIPIVGDSTSYERALKRSETATKQFGNAIGTTSPRVGKLQTTMGVAGTSTVAFAGAAAGLAVALGSKSIDAASALNEQLDRTRVILGSSADAMVKWSQTTAESMGISQTEALAATATFAGLFQTVGLGQAKAGGFSRVLVQLAADLASLQNSSPEEALTALRSGLAGEAEPLRRFNIFLTEARVQQEALAETGKTTTSALTQQEKTLARYNLILKDAAPAMGNFAATSGSLANQQRVLAAQVTDLEAKLGTVLLPTVTNLVTTLNDVIGVTEDVLGALGKLRDFGPISIPIDVAIKLSFAGKGTGGIKAVIGEIKEKTADAVESGLTAGLGPIQNLEDLFAGRGGRGFTLFPSAVERGGSSKTRKTAAETAAANAAADRKRIAAANAIIAAITNTATAQRSFNQQIADSEKRAAHLRDLIRTDPDNAKLQRRLTAELKLQASLREQSATAARASAQEARSAAESAKAEAEAVAAARRERERMAAEARRAAVKANQFKALGLTAEGLKPTPGSGSLLQRALGLQDRIKGTALDTDKTRRQLRRIVNVLRKDFKTAGKDVRQAILQMLNDISGAFDEGAAKSGPLTKSHGLRTAQIIKNLGLSVEQAEEIQRRLAHATTSGGRTLSSAAGRGVATLPRQGIGAMPVVVESHTTINLDGHKIANVVTRSQQKDRRRNPKQKRGPHRN